MRARLAATALASAALVAVTGCGAANPANDGQLRVVATTPMIADIATRIAGPDASVTSLIPKGADPHSYEPSLRRGRDLAYADVALTNHLLLEPQSVMRQVRGTLAPDSTLVELSEESERYGAQLIPVVENPVLDQLWLGLRVAGSGRNLGADAEDASVRLLKAEGPGRALGFITETFGAVEPIFDSNNTGLKGMALPPYSHTHLSWAFTKPGTYRLTFSGFVGDKRIGTPQTVTFAVGSVPQSTSTRKVVDAGHADITLNLDSGNVDVRAEQTGVGVKRRQVNTLRASGVIIGVGPKALSQVPQDGSQRELGAPGQSIYLLPQAVLGKHVHGESDPHVWLSPANVQAWAKRIREAFIAKDPQHAAAYRKRTDDLLAQLDSLDKELHAKFASIEPKNRKLVTTHDAFGYLARTYGLEVSGFAVPATGSEPGARERARLQAAVRDLKVPAVFVGAGESSAAATLRRVASSEDVRVCSVASDTLDERLPTYEALMRFNADHISACLSGKPEPELTQPALHQTTSMPKETS